MRQLKLSHSSECDCCHLCGGTTGCVTKAPPTLPRGPQMSREGMEESYETFEEELWPPRADPPPQKPVRQIRRPEMFSTRKVREEMVPQQPKAEPKTLPREPSIPITTTLPKAVSIQNLSQIDTPWQNVTLNRCLFVAITILVLTSGFQKLHETMRGQGTAEEEEETVLAVRRPGALRHRGQPPEPETTLWEVMFSWLPDLDDEDEEEEEEDDADSGEVKNVKSKTRSAKGLRNKPLPDKKLMKQREGKLKVRRAKKTGDEETKEKKERDKTDEPDEEADDEDVEEEEEAVPKKPTKKDKKKTQKG
ncbi:junctional sarcoplasmic reticulum protein 1 isoform X2 [Notolabrus celidotus]|uniref:junctional sarcoplasmic reticulum protein 1 isoform X2 n=1 Tax=Notolabrus celidotus TaxID=1203425 RepID=UPI00148FF5E2|nr:junctional sarcoplasmic reticulum protein 1 isoform X2 [Notolabrus celidotus]